MDKFIIRLFLVLLFGLSFPEKITLGLKPNEKPYLIFSRDKFMFKTDLNFDKKPEILITEENKILNFWLVDQNNDFLIYLVGKEDKSKNKNYLNKDYIPYKIAIYDFTKKSVKNILKITDNNLINDCLLKMGENIYLYRLSNHIVVNRSKDEFIYKLDDKLYIYNLNDERLSKIINLKVFKLNDLEICLLKPTDFIDNKVLLNILRYPEGTTFRILDVLNNDLTDRLSFAYISGNYFLSFKDNENLIAIEDDVLDKENGDIKLKLINYLTKEEKLISRLNGNHYLTNYFINNYFYLLDSDLPIRGIPLGDYIYYYSFYKIDLNSGKKIKLFNKNFFESQKNNKSIINLPNNFSIDSKENYILYSLKGKLYLYNLNKEKKKIGVIKNLDKGEIIYLREK